VAEIRVERKKTSPWTWLIGLLLLVLLVWGLSRLLGTGGAPEVRDGAAPVGALPQGHPAPAAKAPAPNGREADRDAASDSDQAEALRLRSRMMA
jgi:hypothetical protein